MARTKSILLTNKRDIFFSVRTALLAIIGFMPTHGNGAIGSLDYTPEERKLLAKRSVLNRVWNDGSNLPLF